jgi:hypothetical protein
VCCLLQSQPKSFGECSQRHQGKPAKSSLPPVISFLAPLLVDGLIMNAFTLKYHNHLMVERPL